MSLINDLIARQGEEVALKAVSHRAVAVAVGHLYLAAAALRASPGVNANDVSQYLTPAMSEVVRHLQEAGKRGRTPAIERAPSVIEQDLGTPDSAADFLREVNHRGGGVQLR